MARQITTQPIDGISKTAVFENLSITQSSDGRMSAEGRYRIELQDVNRKVLAIVGTSMFGFTQEQLMENPDFLTGYAILRDLARRGLAQSNPDLVIEAHLS